MERAEGPSPLGYLEGLEHNAVDERSSERLYLQMAALDPDPGRAEQFRELARFEAKHASLWEALLATWGRPAPPRRFLLSHRAMVGLAKLLGVSAVIGLLHRGEVTGIATYERQAREWIDPSAQAVFKELLPDEIAHEIDLFGEMRRTRASREGMRSAILGGNDGLGSILALAAGVAGATASSATVLVAGLAGLVAGSVSMGASNYVAVKAEKEAIASRAALERLAVRTAPETRLGRLTDSLRTRGLTPDEVKSVAARLTQDPAALEHALLANAEGDAGPGGAGPLRLAAYTAVAFLAAGAVPLVPFLFLHPEAGVLTAVGVTGAALFFAGVLRAISTFAGPVRSGLEMVFVGLGAAAVTYVVGLAVGSALV